MESYSKKKDRIGEITLVLAAVGILQGLVIGWLWMLTDGFSVERDSRLWKLSFDVCGYTMPILSLGLVLASLCFLLSLFTCLLNPRGGKWRSLLIGVTAVVLLYLSLGETSTAHEKLRHQPKRPIDAVTRVSLRVRPCGPAWSPSFLIQEDSFPA